MRKYAEALAALRGFVRAKCHVGSEVFGHAFGQLLTAWVEDAVGRGWIRLSEGGYATVQLPEQWAIKDRALRTRRTRVAARGYAPAESRSE